MSAYTLAGLYRYPVKSLRGEAFEALDIGRRGFLFDREWMVVDATGRFVTQRQQPRMALVSARVLADGRLALRAPGMPNLTLADGTAGPSDVTVWRDTVKAARVGAPADDWLTDFLGLQCQLVRLAKDTVRPVDPTYAKAGDEVGFADGFPFLLISQASLDDLNRRLEEPLPMQRFRPNLVVSGCEPFAEDAWRRLRIGGVTLRVAKPCSRCIIPTIDPETAERSAEPLRTLMQYRRRENQVFFGQNLIPDTTGALGLGMRVEVLE